MPKQTSKVGVETQLAVVIHCAILVVGLSKDDFRPKDVMFYLDLIKDMVQRGHLGQGVAIQFVQIQRWLQRYEALGWIRIKTIKKIQHYSLRTSGVRGLVKALMQDQHLLDVPEVLLIQQMLDAYGPFLQTRLLPKVPREYAEPWLQKILEAGALIKNQIRLLDSMIHHHERRNRDSLHLQTYCSSSLDAGHSMEVIVASIPSEFSYQLSHQKQFRELMQEVPQNLAAFEIRQGFALRHQKFYEPTLRYLRLRRDFYQQLLTDM